MTQAPVAYHTVFQVGAKDLLPNLLWFILPIGFFFVGIEYARGKRSSTATWPRAILRKYSSGASASCSEAESAKPTIRSRILMQIVGFVLIAFSCVLGYTFAKISVEDFVKLRVALKHGWYQVAEGPVENFVPMPYQGHAVEHFTVGGIRFAYSTYEVTNCFNHTASHGGPVRAGLHVRISYVGGHPGLGSNCILRLETVQEVGC